MANHGSFSGNPRTEWLVDAVAPDRGMELLYDFSFTDPAGTLWPAMARSMSREAQLSQITEGLSAKSASCKTSLPRSRAKWKGCPMNRPWRNSMRPSRSTSRSNPSGPDFSPLEHL